MAQNVTIAGASYSAVPAIDVPKTGGGTATYTDVSDTTASAGDVASGKYFYTASGVKTVGTYPIPELDFIDYLQSSGTQYIDTGFVVANNANPRRIVIDYMPLAVSSTYYNYRVSGAYNGTTRVLSLYGASSDGRFGVGAGDIQLGVSFNANTRYLVDLTAGNGSITGTINGVDIGTKTYTNYNYAGSYPMFLFAMNQLGTAVNLSSIKLYSCKIYDNGVLLRDLRPAKRRIDNALGLWDSVCCTLFFNAGSGTFIAP